MLTMNQAKQVVQDSFNRYSGLDCVLPSELLFSWAGNVRFNKWGEVELLNVFRIHFASFEV